MPINPLSSNLTPTFHQDVSSTRCRNQTDYTAHTLCSLKEGKKTSFIDTVKGYIYTGWDYLTAAFNTCWEWLTWIAYCCPRETSPLEIVEAIVKNPKKMGKEYADDVEKTLTELSLSALLDPEGYQGLRTKNFKELKQFFVRLKKDYSTEKRGLDEPFSDKTSIQLGAFILLNSKRLIKGLENVAVKALAILGNEDKEGDSKAVKALRYFCKKEGFGHLKKWIEASTLNETFLRNSNDQKSSQRFSNWAANHLQNSHEIIDLFSEMMSSNGLVLQQLEKPRLLNTSNKDYENAEHLGFKWEEVLFQSAWKELTSSDLKNCANQVENPQLKQLLASCEDLTPKEMRKLAANQNLGVEMANQVYRDFSNPEAMQKS